MPTITRPAALFGGLLASLALATAGGAMADSAMADSAMASESPNGYRSADFGMSSEAVLERLEQDRVVNVSVRETEDNDLIIDGELQAEDEPATDLRYVFPEGRDQLALVVAFHPNVEDYASVKAELEARYGKPWEEEMAEWWFEQLKEGMPEAPNSLTVWGGDGDEARERGRFVRLWSFEEYLSVEYLDTQMFR